MELKERIYRLEIAGLNWFLIAEILDISYDEVRYISENN